MSAVQSPSDLDPGLAATIAGNIEAIRKRIAKTAMAARRDPAAIRLIAVSKAQPMDRIRAAMAAGHLVLPLIGEGQYARRRGAPQ